MYIENTDYKSVIAKLQSNVACESAAQCNTQSMTVYSSLTEENREFSQKVHCQITLITQKSCNVTTHMNQLIHQVRHEMWFCNKIQITA